MTTTRQMARLFASPEYQQMLADAKRDLVEAHRKVYEHYMQRLRDAEAPKA